MSLFGPLHLIAVVVLLHLLVLHLFVLVLFCSVFYYTLIVAGLTCTHTSLYSILL